MKNTQQSAFDLRSRMEPNESREQSGKSKENLVDSDLTPLPSAIKDLPTVIIDPSLKAEAGQAEEKKRGRRRSKRPRGQLSHQKSDTSVRPSDELSAVEAERFANSIRPSWEPAAPAPVSSDNGLLGVNIEHSLDESRASHPGIAAAATPLKIPYQTFSKQHMVWAGGAVVAVGVLLTLIISTSNSGSSVAGAAKKRLSKAATTGLSQSAPSRKLEKQAIARNDLPRTSPKEALAPVVNLKPPQAPPSSIAQTATAPSVPIVQEAPKTVPVVESKVRIRVETSPKDAQLFLDGALVSTPFDNRVALSGKHQFEARLEGFQSAARTVDFNQDRLVFLSLSKVPTQTVTVSQAPSRRQVVAQNTSVKAVKRPTKQAAVKLKSPVRHRTASPTKSLGAGFVSANPY